MLFLDVNVLVQAHRPDTAMTGPAVAQWLQETLQGSVPVGVTDAVLASAVRVLTNPRIYDEPTPPASAAGFAHAVRQASPTVVLRPGDRAWEMFTDLVRGQRLRGNDVPDAYLAAVALERAATMVTMDRGFARFEGLRVLHPGSP
jgi:toxin-antitoxin system PIN domain toxin